MKQQIFKFGDYDVPMIPPEEWMLSETRAVQRWLGEGIETQGSFMQASAAIAVSVARRIPTWTVQSFFDSHSNGDIVAIIEQLKAAAEDEAPAIEQGGDDDEFASPTPAAAQHDAPAASPRSTKRGKSTGDSR